MSENLLDAATATKTPPAPPASAGNATGTPGAGASSGVAPALSSVGADSGVRPPTGGTAATRPEYLPEKFWDTAAGEARVESLARSYAELEKKLGAGAGVPADPSGYRIESRDEVITPDPEINALLHKTGFTQAQAQLVYDMAAERLVPMIGEIAARFEADSQTERLARHFGSEDKWREISRQVTAWGRAKLPQSAFGALSSTYEGVVAMHRMMTSGEPGLVRGETAGGPMTESAIEDLMRDPRYWRDHEPGIVARVTEGFRRLYPGNA